MIFSGRGMNIDTTMTHDVKCNDSKVRSKFRATKIYVYKYLLKPSPDKTSSHQGYIVKKE